MVEKYKCAIVQILYIIHFQPKFVADDYRMIIFSLLSPASEGFQGDFKKKRKLFTFYYETTNKSSRKIKQYWRKFL